MMLKMNLSNKDQLKDRKYQIVPVSWQLHADRVEPALITVPQLQSHICARSPCNLAFLLADSALYPCGAEQLLWEDNFLLVSHTCICFLIKPHTGGLFTEQKKHN